jgi:hypothetical protein
MRNLKYAVVVLGAIAAIGVWSAPSMADMWNGPKQQNGKCWQTGQNGFPQGIGYWADCPKPAAAPVPQTTSRRHHS